MISMVRNLFKAAAILVVSTVLFCSNAIAQTDAEAKPAGIVGAQTHIDKFFRSYKEDSHKAVFELFKTNPLIDSAQLKTLVEQINKTRVTLGPYIGKELINQKKASNSLILYTYLAKHEAQPVRFTFMFYKPKNDWVIYRFYFDGNIEQELQDAAKLDK